MRGYCALALYNPKNSLNVGHVLRAAGCFEANLVVLGGCRIPVKAITDTQKAWRHIPTIRLDDIFDAQPYDAISVAIEICDGARPLTNFVHPERGFYVFGPEDNSLPDKVFKRCQHRIIVPTVSCMNLAATVNVVLYDRLAKAERYA